jgi:SAM-dependent methyltransferase
VLTEATQGIMHQRNVSETGMGTTPRRSAKVGALLHRLASEYPEGLRAGQHADVDRIAFHLSIVIRETGTACTVCDLGGGVGLFSVGAAALGMAAVLVDDFGDQLNLDYGEDALTAHRKYGVRVLSTDVLTKDLGLEPSSLDAITSFDSMEHWHHSPKAAFHRMMAALKPGGVFFLGVPNCVNLRKRITVPLGAGRMVRAGDVPWPRQGARRRRPSVHRPRSRAEGRADLRPQLARLRLAARLGAGAHATDRPGAEALPLPLLRYLPARPEIALALRCRFPRHSAPGTVDTCSMLGGRTLNPDSPDESNVW